MSLVKLKILKTFVGQAINEKGEWLRVDKEKIYIESGGDLRMVLLVPLFIAKLITEHEVREMVKAYGCEFTNTTKGAPADAITGRSPDDLERARKRVFTNYVERLQTLNLRPIIEVQMLCRLPEDRKRSTYDLGFSRERFQLRLDIQRYMADDKRVFYWPDKKGEVPRHSHYVDRQNNPRSGLVVLEYTDDLWHRLQVMEDTLARGTAKLHDLVFGENFAQQLLTGDVPQIGLEK